MTNPVVECVNLSKDHVSHFVRKRTRVLDRVNLSVERNETFGLLGLNGAGKTTTLKLLLGLLRPTEGQARVLGHAAGDRQALARIGFLPENPYFYSYLTAWEFLDFAGQMFGLKRSERAARAQELLRVVSMTEARDVPVYKYSKGMLQRLGIAQSLINDPEVIFLDEPMSGLDPIGRRDVRDILIRLKSEGKSIFFNSHLLPDVNDVCDRVAILHRGVLVGCQSVQAISGSGSYRDLEEYFMETVAGAEAARLERLKAG